MLKCAVSIHALPDSSHKDKSYHYIPLSIPPYWNTAGDRFPSGEIQTASFIFIYHLKSLMLKNTSFDQKYS